MLGLLHVQSHANLHTLLAGFMRHLLHCFNPDSCEGLCQAYKTTAIYCRSRGMRAVLSWRTYLILATLSHICYGLDLSVMAVYRPPNGGSEELVFNRLEEAFHILITRKSKVMCYGDFNVHL
ncbi:hypothetical protein J6590_086863 [Homalodisca vitripennis]|nr:hypothetical protein J6590_086863 [Homalodisca vitripennis]